MKSFLLSLKKKNKNRKLKLLSLCCFSVNKNHVVSNQEGNASRYKIVGERDKRENNHPLKEQQMERIECMLARKVAEDKKCWTKSRVLGSSVKALSY